MGPLLAPYPALHGEAKSLSMATQQLEEPATLGREKLQPLVFLAFPLQEVLLAAPAYADPQLLSSHQPCQEVEPQASPDPSWSLVSAGQQGSSPFQEACGLWPGQHRMPAQVPGTRVETWCGAGQG